MKVILCIAIGFIAILVKDNLAYTERFEQMQIDYDTLEEEKDDLYYKNIEKNFQLYGISEELTRCKADLRGKK